MRTRVFIDSMMLHRDAVTHGYDVDYKRVHDFYLPETGETVALTVYHIEALKQDGTSTLRRLIDWLELNGFRCRVVEVDIDEKNSVRDARPELMVWMAADILSAAEQKADRIVVWANDRALVPALAGAREAGSVVELIAEPEHLSGSLKRACDLVADIGRFRGEIAKEKATA